MALRKAGLTVWWLALLTGGWADAEGTSTTAATSPATSASTSATSPTAVRLRQQLVPGRYVVTQTMDMRQAVTADGAKKPAQHIVHTLRTLQEISAPDAAGSQTVTITFQRIQQQIEVGEQAVRYDSQGPPGEQDPNLAAMFEALKAARIVVTVAGDGKLKDVSGIDPVWDRLIKEAPAAKEMLQQIKKPLIDGLLAGLLARAHELLPAKPLELGETWQAAVQYDMPFGGQMPYQASCKLRDLQPSPGGTLATVDFSGELIDEKEATVKLAAAELTIRKMSFSQTGQFLMNASTGMVLHRKLAQKGEMDLAVKSPDGQATQMSFKQEMDGAYSLQPAEDAQTAPASQPAKQAP